MTRLTSFEIWTYRRMFKISWKDRVTNEEVLRRMGNNAEVVDIIKSRKLRYYGHIRRHDSVQRDLLEGSVEGKRSRGRPITTWMDNIKEWTNISMREVVTVALDRNNWKMVIAANVFKTRL